VPVNDVSGVEFRDPERWRKALGLKERPLGPAVDGWVTSTDLYRSILDAQPYRVRGLVGFGANLLLSHADGGRGARALCNLEFHVQTDLYLTPTAAFADIVLPIASGWEREGLRVGFGLDQTACEHVQLRPEIVPARGEARADIDVVFDLAVRLGLGDRFWNGNVEAALTHHLAPSELTPAMLRNAPRRTIRMPLETRYRKYREQGFGTPSGKVEIFSTPLQAIGQSPLPEFRAPRLDPTSEFPIVLTSAKTPIYCHSQHRNLPRLRRVVPDPMVEMNPKTAALHEIEQGQWISISTPRGSIQARAQFNSSLADGVVGGQHGWWQSCPDLGLPGYDPLGSDGANINLVIGDEVLDPISGAAPHRCYPAQLRALANSG
jgi:anaerobic selenocysteine-containing dehydrogenase